MFKDIQRCAIAAVNLVYDCHSEHPVFEGLQPLEFSHLHFVPCFSRAASTLRENTAFGKYLSDWKKPTSSGQKSALDNANDIIEDFNITLAHGQALAELIQPLIDLLSTLQILLHSEHLFIHKLTYDPSLNSIFGRHQSSEEFYKQCESLSNVLNGTIIFLKNYKKHPSADNARDFLNAFSHLQTWPTIANPNKEKISELASQIHKKAVPVQPKVAKSARTKELPILSDIRNRVFSQLGKRGSPKSVTGPVFDVSRSDT